MAAFISLSIAVMSLWLSVFFSQRKEGSTLLNQKNEEHYFEEISIDQFSSTQHPLLTIEIEEKPLLVQLDLGLNGEINLSPGILSEINKKSFLRSQINYGLKGTKYSTNVYKIPKARIGPRVFLNPNVQEESQKSYENASIKTNPVGREKLQIEGKVGWEIFKSVNLFMDLRNSKIAFCDSCISLKKEGIAIETFLKAPLLLDRTLVEIEAMTSKGPLRCLLTTGCTRNILRTEPKEGELPEQMLNDERIVIPGFQIGDMNLEKMLFQPLFVALPIQIDVMLGMDFFFEHQIFIDFTNSLIYISPSRMEKDRSTTPP